MKAGEFFVNLGVKGSEKTLGAIANTKKGIGDLGSTSIEAKAAIVGAMYALERLFATSGATGTSLTNFNSLLGVSTQTLQKYQFAARQMGVANEDVAGSFHALQSAMTKTLMGEGAPKGLARVGLLTGGVSPKDIEAFQKNSELPMQKLQQYALKEKNIGLGNETLKSFNLSDPMIAAMRRDAFNVNAFKRAPGYGDKEIASLDRANIAWSNLGTKIEMAVGHFNARHGGQLVKDFDQMINATVKFANALEKLSEKTKIFTLISKTVEAIASALEKTANLLGGSSEDKKKMVGNTFNEMNKRDARPLLEKLNLGVGSKLSTSEIVRQGLVSGAHYNPATGKQDVQFNQTLNFQHDGKDHKKTADSTKKAVQEFYRQNPAQGQGS